MRTSCLNEVTKESVSVIGTCVFCMRLHMGLGQTCRKNTSQIHLCEQQVFLGNLRKWDSPT